MGPSTPDENRVLAAAQVKVVSAAEMRTRSGRVFCNGQWSEGAALTDLRGTPLGDTALVMTFARLVARPGSARRTRQSVSVSYCADGWHSTSGTADDPGGLDICSTILSTRDRLVWEALHATNRVVWKVYASQGGGPFRGGSYCDADLPQEWRVFADHLRAFCPVPEGGP